MRPHELDEAEIDRGFCLVGGASESHPVPERVGDYDLDQTVSLLLGARHSCDVSFAQLLSVRHCISNMHEAGPRIKGHALLPRRLREVQLGRTVVHHQISVVPARDIETGVPRRSSRAAPSVV